jgi:2-deoxy-D-gluconate 3-dehydrogenase
MGIGEAITLRLHEAGASVVVADLDEVKGNRIVDQLNTHRYMSALYCHADVSDEAAVACLVHEAIVAFEHIDILVNNAGIFPMTPLHDMTKEQFDKVLGINLGGVFLLTKYVSEKMIEQNIQGAIVNITSVDALHPSMVGLAHYDASKHGVWGFTKNVALELAQHGIRVNAVAPGGVVTPGVLHMQKLPEDSVVEIHSDIPAKRLGYPDEIARAVVFLSSEMSSYMFGSQVVVDGGMLIS